MREIKFRVWDKRNKKWVEAGQSLLGYLIAWVSDYKFGILGRGDYEIVQYTGIKNKNGKELWESDIIENEHGERWLIVWEGTGFRVALRGNKEAIYAPNEYWFNSCKKIGNIYENPELLEESC